MPFDLEFDDDLGQRRLQRLEQRHRRAQSALAAARAAYAVLREMPGISAARLLEARQRVEQARREEADILLDLHLLEVRAMTGRGRPQSLGWGNFG